MPCTKPTTIAHASRNSSAGIRWLQRVAATSLLLVGWLAAPQVLAQCVSFDGLRTKRLDVTTEDPSPATAQVSWILNVVSSCTDSYVAEIDLNLQDGESVLIQQEQATGVILEAGKTTLVKGIATFDSAAQADALKRWSATVRGTLLQPNTADACLAVSRFESLLLESGSTADRLSWKVDVENSCETSFSSGVRFDMVDAGGFLLSREEQANVLIPAGSTAQVRELLNLTRGRNGSTSVQAVELRLPTVVASPAPALRRVAFGFGGTSTASFQGSSGLLRLFVKLSDGKAYRVDLQRVPGTSDFVFDMDLAQVQRRKDYDRFNGLSSFDMEEGILRIPALSFVAGDRQLYFDRVRLRREDSTSWRFRLLDYGNPDAVASSFAGECLATSAVGVTAAAGEQLQWHFDLANSCANAFTTNVRVQLFNSQDFVVRETTVNALAIDPLKTSTVSGLLPASTLLPLDQVYKVLVTLQPLEP